MYVCLMRHGKAEPYRDDRDDSGRALTSRGIQDVRDMASLVRRWWPDGTTRIWTSPLVRACQTAEIMSQSLQPAAIRTDRFIGDGDLSGLYEELRALPDADTLLIVGHQPYLDQWTAAWTGAPARFKTASLALFSYDPYDGAYGKGKLLFYLHPAGARLFLARDTH